MTLTLRFLMVFVILSGVGLVIGQTDTPPRLISPDDPLLIMLNTESPIDLHYESEGNETISVTVRNVSDEAIDTVLTVMTPAGRHLAYNDDHQRDLPTFEQTDSALIDLLLPDAGVYTIRVNSYGNIAIGEVEVLLTLVDIFAQEIIDEGDLITINAQLPVWQIYRYEVAVAEGDVITLTASDRSNTLDLVMRLVDSDGLILAENDDHSTNDLSLNAFDPQISEFGVLDDGIYTLELWDFRGYEGAFRLAIHKHNP